MIYSKLGSTCYNVSRICFGALTISPLGAGLSVKEGAAVIREAWERGINFLDTAQYYQNYKQIRESLIGWNKDVVIASKSYARTYREMKAAVEEARKELDRDKIEIFLLHEQRSVEDFLENNPALEYLHDAKAKGIVGACGISTHNAKVVKYVSVLPEVEVIHPLVNKLGIGIIGGNLEEMIEAVTNAYQNGKGVYGMKSIGGGSLMNNAKEMMAWALSQEYFHAVAIGMKDKLEVITDIGWFEGIEPKEAGLIKNIDRNLIIDPFPCCTGCGNCQRACPQGAIEIIDNQAVWNKAKCLYCGYCIPACKDFYISFA